jgi:hypothetical protein
MQGRQSIALFFSIVLIGLLAGNMGGYILCRVSAATELAVADCGCDAWLNGTPSSAEAAGDIHSGSLKPVLTESLPPQAPGLDPVPVQCATGCHAAYASDLPDRPGDAIFHPPALH